jgi:hypothetical protein
MLLQSHYIPVAAKTHPKQGRNRMSREDGGNRTDVHLAFNQNNSFPATFFLLASVKKMAWQDQWSQRVGV